jgi:hypothetical protein
MRSMLIVIAPPCDDSNAHLGEAGEPVIVQAFVSEAAIETLDVGVLIRPLIQCLAGKRWPLIGSDCRRHFPRPQCSLQHRKDVVNGNPMLSHQIDRFLGEVIHDGQYYDPPTAASASLTKSMIHTSLAGLAVPAILSRLPVRATCSSALLAIPRHDKGEVPA